MKKYSFHSQENDYYCGPACLQMALESFGLQFSQKQLAKKLKTTKKFGTKNKNIIRVVSELGFRCFEKRNAKISDLATSIRQGRVIVNYLEPEENIGHLALVRRVSEKYIFLCDPWHGRNFRIKSQEFFKRWRSFEKNYEKWFLFFTKLEGRKFKNIL